MGAKTGIEWTDSTWNPVRGCSRVSEGCRHCYAEGMAARFSGDGQAYSGLAVMQHGKPHWTGKIEFVEKHLLDPLKWGPVITGCLTGRELPHAKRGHCPDCKERPRRIFVNSMSDLFHEGVTDEMRDKIFAVMALCRQHVFQVLTKRPARMVEYFGGLLCGRISFAAARIIEANWPRLRVLPTGFRWSIEGPAMCRVSGGVGEYWPLPNVWLGVSVENQETADERIPLLLQTPAAVRFISAEPLLGPINLVEMENTVCRFNPLPVGYEGAITFYLDSLRGCRSCVLDNCDTREEEDGWIPKIDWVICGGESGPWARPMHPDWARGLRDQCVAAGVPFFFKQWGEYLGAMQEGPKDEEGGQTLNCSDQPTRVGKRGAGALLDGVEWKQFPEVVR